jgi:hypothetical protein
MRRAETDERRNEVHPAVVRNGTSHRLALARMREQAKTIAQPLNGRAGDED